jgi:hypothetical protein
MIKEEFVTGEKVKLTMKQKERKEQMIQEVL